MKDVEGIKVKEFFIWVLIIVMKLDLSFGDIVFFVGFVFKFLLVFMFNNVFFCFKKFSFEF